MLKSSAIDRAWTELRDKEAEMTQVKAILSDECDKKTQIAEQAKEALALHKIETEKI